MPRNFALIGAAGYIAPRHMKAIYDTGNQIIAATDPHDAVGILDRYSMSIRFFPEIERFDRHIEKLRRGPEDQRVHFVSICSPNYLHDAHIRLALRTDADAICEKPVVINPWNLDALELIERETGHSVFTVLQLRLHPVLLDLKKRLQESRSDRKHDVLLTYISGRGAWYGVSWKGSETKSGGIAINIGIHLFDLLIWLFGNVKSVQLHHRCPTRMSGFIEMENANVRWFLSIDAGDISEAMRKEGAHTVSILRTMTIDGEVLHFSEGFTDLHSKVYEQTLAGHGFRIADARPSIELAYAIRSCHPAWSEETSHPCMKHLRIEG